MKSKSNAAIPDDPNPQLADAVERVAASVVAIDAGRRGGGSGLLWQSGVVVSAASAVHRADKVTVVLPNGEHLDGVVKGVDIGTDLAAIALDTGALASSERSALTSQRAGDFVFAAGRDRSGMVNASFGHIGAVAGAWRSWRGARIDRFIRLDGGLYPGMSGAPIADSLGQVIGMASNAFSRLHGIVVPISTIERVVTQLLAQGHVSRGYFGVAAQAAQLSESVRTAMAVESPNALLVSAVARTGPAAAAGLLVGDLIVSVAGRSIASIDDLRELLGDASAAAGIGERVAVRVARGGQSHELSIEVAARPRSVCG